MGVFDSPSDTPNQIKTEGENITVKFASGKPQTGQATISWNIPAPALGCASDSEGSYCGIVFLLSNEPLTVDHTPENGRFYVADPTGDADIHAGDRIGDALVIGAFYEGEKKARGETLTTEFTVDGISSLTPYYVAGYAVDCQGRYHKDGQRAYSADYGNVSEPGQPASQVVVLNDEQGVLPTDGTGLVPGMPYEFEFVVNEEFPDITKDQIIKFEVNGEDALTYEDLISEVNKVMQLVGNPPQSPTVPNMNRYYWNGKEMGQWDGKNHVPVDAFIEPEDPADIAMGDYWYEKDTNQLQRFNIPSPIGWNPITTITYKKDPTALAGGGDFWHDGTKAYSWCSTTWCEEVVYNQAEDPGALASATCGSYWFDETESVLKNYNPDFGAWVEVNAIEWEVNPNDLLVGTYWFNDTDKKLYQYNGTDFIQSIAIVGAAVDGLPADNQLWYNPETEELQEWIPTTAEWVLLDVLSWPYDPRDRESCQLWWDTITDKLYLWDVVNSEWDEVQDFTVALEDPYGTPNINAEELWFDGTNMYRWDGQLWKEVSFIQHPVPPNVPNTGDAWFNPENNTWHIWDTPNAGWNAINPIDSDGDPLSVPNEALWFDTTNNVFLERQGSSWVTVPFSTQPFYPKHGDFWFDSVNEKLMQWEADSSFLEDGTPNGRQGPGKWVEATPIAEASLNDKGHFVLSTTGTGSDKMIMILVPEGVPHGPQNVKATGTAGLDVGCCYHYGSYANIDAKKSSTDPEIFLFQNLVLPGVVHQHAYGNDAIIPQLPSYATIGVGDDGSPDERREIMDWVRSQLGYPTVDVELTQKQVDESVDMALETIRQRTSVAYERTAFFLDVVPGEQRYYLTDQRCGFHKVVTVTSAHRFTSAFLSSAHGAGVYGQIVLQHLYNMGTFDLLSYHLVSEYVEQLEHLFATRLVFNWQEHSRVLSFYQAFTVPERILLDVMIEKSEQTIMKDRWVRTWVKRYALMNGMQTLAQIRGKFASLPGAGGGIQLNAADLMSRADSIREELNMEIEDFISEKPEDLGMHSTFIMG